MDLFFRLYGDIPYSLPVFPRYVVDSIQSINGQNAYKIKGLRVLNSLKTHKVKPMILSAFWPFMIVLGWNLRISELVVPGI